MKICLYNVTSTMAPIGSSEVGGVEAYSFRLGKALLERGHDVHLYGGRPHADVAFPSVLPQRLFPYRETSSFPEFGTRFQRLMQRLHFAWKAQDLIKGNFDAIFIFKPYDFVSAWVWRICGVRSRIVASLHGREFFPGDRFFSQSVDALYAVGSSTAGPLEQRYGRRCEVIPIFLANETFTLLDRPVPPEEKQILCVGRMVAMKGMDVLMRAFGNVQARIPSARLILIGDGPERPVLEKLADQLKIRPFVEMPGVLSEREILRRHPSCWVYVQPSTGDETFSVSTLEAFASGLNVIASDRVHVAREFRRDDAVQIYPAHDGSELNRLLGQNLSQPWSEVVRRGQRAWAKATKDFSADAILPRIEELCAPENME